MRLLRSVGAFLFGFVGSVVFTVPVLFLLQVAAVYPWFLAVVVIFTVSWWFAWTYVGNRINVYSDNWLRLAYSMGGGIGFVLALYYESAINGFLGV